MRVSVLVFRVQPCRWPVGKFDQGGNFLEDKRPIPLPAGNVQHRIKKQPLTNNRLEYRIERREPLKDP